MAAGICDDRHGFYLNTGSTKEYPLVSLGETLDDAQAKARELIAVLDAFVNPWTTDGSLPKGFEHEVELSIGGRTARGHHDGLGWRVIVGGRNVRIASDEIDGWREFSRPVVGEDRKVSGWETPGPTTAPTGAKEFL